MNRTILLTTAALAAAFIQPVQASAHGGGGGNRGGGGGGGGGGMRAGGGGAAFRGGGGASMHVSQAPHFSQASHFASPPQSMPRAATQAQSFAFRQPTQPSRNFTQANPRATVTNRSFNGTNRQSPTFAFGGTAPRNRNANVQANRNFDNRTADTRNFSRPSGDVSRNWDRHQIHNWNHHRYRWYNNDWVLLDGGFGYGYPYYYGYAPDNDYDYDSAPYDNATSALPYEYSTTDSVASSVQEELVRKGYNPGAVDGVIGPQTRNAIAQYQNDHRLPVTGQIDRQLLGAMGL